jgi:hypothetical protein
MAHGYTDGLVTLHLHSLQIRGEGSKGRIQNGTDVCASLISDLMDLWRRCRMGSPLAPSIRLHHVVRRRPPPSTVPLYHSLCRGWPLPQVVPKGLPSRHHHHICLNAHLSQMQRSKSSSAPLPTRLCAASLGICTQVHSLRGRNACLFPCPACPGHTQLAIHYYI